jgi:hypothetical protein
MTNFLRAVSSGIVAFSMLLNLVPTVSAHEQTTSFLPTAFSSWSTFGSPSVFTDRVTVEGSQREWVWIDLDARYVDENYVVIASYADKSDDRFTMSSANRSRSGNPYIYAYLMDGNGRIQKYLSGTTTMSTSRADSDYVVYGIFPTVANIKTIRVFLKQSSVKNITNSGANVSFMRPILAEASSNARANEIVNAYANQNLSLSYQGVTISNGSNTSTNPPTPTPSTVTTNNCAGTRGNYIFNDTFENSEARNSNMKFGAASALWAGVSHDYQASYSPYDYVVSTDGQGGARSVMLNNPNYSVYNTPQFSTGVFYEEAMRHITTGLLEPNAQYVLSVRAKYIRGTSNAPSVWLSLGQETGADGVGVFANITGFEVGDSWVCKEMAFTNSASRSTPQDVVLYFGELTKGASLAIDQIQLIKK